MADSARAIVSDSCYLRVFDMLAPPHSEDRPLHHASVGSPECDNEFDVDPRCEAGKYARVSLINIVFRFFSLSFIHSFIPRLVIAHHASCVGERAMNR